MCVSPKRARARSESNPSMDDVVPTASRACQLPLPMADNRTLPSFMRGCVAPIQISLRLDMALPLPSGSAASPSTDSVGESVAGPSAEDGAMGESPRRCAVSGALANDMETITSHVSTHDRRSPLLGVERRCDARREQRAGVTELVVGSACGLPSGIPGSCVGGGR